MADLSQIHDGRPVLEDQVFGWRALERAWQNFATLVAVLRNEHGDDGSHSGLAQAIADLDEHVGSRGDSHGVVTSSEAGFATPAMLGSIAGLEALATIGGAFIWTGTRWECPKPAKVQAIGSHVSTGVCEIVFDSALPSADHYRVAVAQHAGSDPAFLQVEKMPDRVFVHVFDAREQLPLDGASFDLTILPIAA